MYAPVYHYVPERFVYQLGHLIVNRSIRRHLRTPVTACPVFRCDQKFPTDPLVPSVLSYVPTLDKAYRLGKVAAVCMGAQADLKKTNYFSFGRLGN
jgi:hypothetical protein